jgi:hypothetical protein
MEQEKTPSSEQGFVQTVHTDGTVSLIDSRAMGGSLEHMPKGYFYSVQFIGTVIVSYLVARREQSR